MLVSHISTLLDGGASIAARRLHEALLRSGTDSRLHYSKQLNSPRELDPSYQASKWRKQGFKQQMLSQLQFRAHRRSFRRVIRQRPDRSEVFTSSQGAAHTPWPPVGHRLPAGEREIINLHWIAKFIDYTSFFGSLASDQPVVWTLHDMNPFTGGCHFGGGCDRYQSGCGNCPQLAAGSANDISRKVFAEKQAALAGLNLHIVAPSRWLLRTAESSFLLRNAKSFSHIPYGISTNDFYPMDRMEARARLGIDPNATVFCFGATDVKNRRKGAHHLYQALSSIADLENVQGLVFGSGELPQTSGPLPSIIRIGRMQGLLQKRAVYSASDVFVLPSLEDNLPLTGLESLACGTAIVGFDAGGIPDYVRPHKTGLLARTGDVNDLGHKLRTLLSQPSLARTMGKTARRMIEQEYTSKHEAVAYSDLYNSLTDQLGQTHQAAA